MEDILNIIGKKNTINGKFNINIDDDFIFVHADSIADVRLYKMFSKSESVHDSTC